MKASNARALSSSKRKSDFDGFLKENMEGTPEEQEDFLFGVVTALLDENIGFVAQEGKTSLMLEPFAAIPGNYHLEDREDRLMTKVAAYLLENDYQKISWDRRDKRVVLRFEW